MKVQQNMVDTPNHIDVQVVQWIPFGGIFKIVTIGFTDSKILVSTGSPAITIVWQHLHTMASASFGNEILNMTLVVSHCNQVIQNMVCVVIIIIQFNHNTFKYNHNLGQPKAPMQ